MDELNDCGKIVVMPPLIAHSASYQQYQRRSHSLAATADDVFCNLANQYHIGVKTIAYDRIHGLHIWPD